MTISNMKYSFDFYYNIFGVSVMSQSWETFTAIVQYQISFCGTYVGYLHYIIQHIVHFIEIRFDPDPVFSWRLDMVLSWSRDLDSGQPHPDPQTWMYNIIVLSLLI